MAFAASARSVKMMRLLPGSAALLSVVLLACGIWWLMHAQQDTMQPLRPGDKPPSGVEMRFNHVTFRGVSDGKVAWEMEADSFDLSKNQLTLNVNGLKKMALLKDGKQELTIDAEGLQRNNATGDLTIHGHVMVMGDDIILRTPEVFWSDRMQLLSLPQRLSAQLGDITLTAEGGAQYYTVTGSLRCDGRIFLNVKGNTFHAKSVTIDTKNNRLHITGPASAEIDVEEVEKWLGGKDLPKIPPIPDSVKQKYDEYCRKKGLR